MCFSKGCERSRKSIKRDRIEGDFVALLDQLTPKPSLFNVTRAMFRDAWEQRNAQALVIRQSYDQELVNVDRQIAGLFDRVVDASTTVAKAFEKRIEELERSP